jgi:hypothetical protein
VIGSLPDVPALCASEYLLGVPSVVAAAPHPPLARIDGVVMRKNAARHLQLVPTDRSTLTEGCNYGVLSPHVWRLADLGAKHAFLRAGLGGARCRCIWSSRILPAAPW